MSKSNTKIYTITALANMHPGSGDANYGIIDKQVQRDVIDPFPTIHSSGLKGAFRELFEEYLNFDNRDIINIFGGEKEDSGKNDTTKKMTTGQYHFFNAQMLVLPVRSNVHPFYRATSPEIIQEFLRKTELFNIAINNDLKSALETLSKVEVNVSNPLHFESDDLVVLEDYRAEAKNFDPDIYKTLTSLLGERIALFNHSDLKKLADDLPIIARNQLENGESQNLWYEEVVPRETKFYFIVKHQVYNSNKDKSSASKTFDDGLSEVNGLVQIGGNASIGYGYSLIKAVE